MRHVAWDKLTDKAVTPTREPMEGEWHKDTKTGVKKEYHASVATSELELKIASEKSWRNSELLRTDEFVKLPDYPVDLLPYRQLLRDYPAQPDFPDGARPTL